MKFLKIAFRHLLGHGTGNATNGTLRDDPWCCGEHSNIHVRRPRTVGYSGLPARPVTTESLQPADRRQSDPDGIHKICPSTHSSLLRTNR